MAMTHNRIRGRLKRLESERATRKLRPAEIQRRAMVGNWQWHCAGVERLIAAVDEDQRVAVVEALFKFLKGEQELGRGFWVWAFFLAPPSGHPLPERVPPAVIEIYLQDPRATPSLFDCEDCGLLVPIRPPVIDDRSFGPDRVFRGAVEKEVRYFQTCPHYGGRIAWQGYVKKRGALC
jgi:hypothetical protein